MSGQIEVQNDVTKRLTHSKTGPLSVQKCQPYNSPFECAKKAAVPGAWSLMGQAERGTGRSV